MPEPTPVGLREVVPWILGIAGLAWNLFNWRRTSRLAGEVRLAQFDFDEWKAHRSAIVSRLDDFETSGDMIIMLTNGQHKAKDLIEILNASNENLVIKHEALIRSLEKYGDSSWSYLGYGASVNGESDWDLLNQILADIPGCGTDADAMRTKIEGMKRHFRSIAAGITRRISDETAQHRPQND